MKKIVVTFVLTFISFVTSAQEIEAILTSGKWFVESIQEKGEAPEFAANKTDEWLLFKKDGKVEEVHFGDFQTLSWNYSSSKKMITILGSETIFYKIIEVSKGKLTVEAVEDIKAQADDGLIITYVQ